MQFEFEGKPWEFSHYGGPREGEIFINRHGFIHQAFCNYTSSTSRLILKPLETHHTFGGVVWKEEKRRHMCAGEVSLNEGANCLHHWGYPSAQPHIPLTPIALA